MEGAATADCQGLSRNVAGPTGLAVARCFLASESAHTHAHTHTHTASCGESPPHPLHQGLTPTHLSTTFSGGHSQAPPHLHYSLILALHINSIYHNFNYIYVIGNYFISVSCHKTSRSVKARTTSILLSNNYAMPTTLPGT